ncbi:hypothetical protein ACFQZ8_08150 [Micromonospora azadirachtae]|uniref:Uncharacterized protein n=1 Tax=Micromonospora azadirachtae TaxID=1970735 RepID=A0ABW2ZZT2_9ACTN
MAALLQPSTFGRSEADDVEQHACPKCGAQPGSMRWRAPNRWLL